MGKRILLKSIDFQILIKFYQVFKRFVSYELAVLRANQINKENDYEVNDGKYLRAYACQECRGYHLTSQTKKEAINRKQKRFNHWLNQEVNYWESRFNIK